MSGALLTIGHSTRSLVEFLALLQENGVELLVDVRRLPGSSRYPHFNEDVLAEALAAEGVDFRRAEALTGRRRVSKTVPFETNAWWTNRSFHNYADHALGEEFRAGLQELRAWGAERTAAVMCSEAVWWRCHRRIIADHVIAGGGEVRHILGPGHTDAAELSAGAVLGEDRQLTYPAQ